MAIVMLIYTSYLQRGVCLMKLLQFLVISAFVLFSATKVHADSVSTGDARIIVGSGGDPVDCGLHFKIQVNKKDGGSIDCKNTSGEDWVGLTITGVAKTGKINFGPGNVACDGTSLDLTNLFTSCNAVITTDPKHKNQEIVVITFSGGEITPGELFFINLNDDFVKKGQGGSKGSWIGDSNQQIEADAVPGVVSAPEPGTIALLLTGWGGIWFWRRQHSPKTQA